MENSNSKKRHNKTNYKNIMAIIFIFLIFYIGIATLPETFIETGKFLEGQGKGISANITEFIIAVDESYSNMLSFKGKNLQNKGIYINLNGFMAKAMGQIEMNNRIKLKNGHLTYISNEQNGNKAVKQISKFYKKQNEKGKEFLFVVSPMQISKYEELLPDRFKSRDFTNHNADYVIEELNKLNVPVLDLRDEMLIDGIDHTSNFFITDHHWKPELGFWGYTKIVDYLTQNKIISNIDSKYTDINQFNIENFEDWFLGSHGKRTGKYFAGLDDFSIITPKFDTSINLEIKSHKIVEEGRFEEVVFDRRLNRKDYFLTNPYGTYGYGDKGHIKYRNPLVPSDKKFLLIGDSFSNVPFPYMSLITKFTDQLDMRHYKDDFLDYYDSYDPDVVIVLVNAYSINGENTTYNFFNDL